jgi:inosine/xanthosine triphosphate pyrophosphatase family protein
MDEEKRAQLKRMLKQQGKTHSEIAEIIKKFEESEREEERAQVQETEQITEIEKQIAIAEVVQIAVNALDAEKEKILADFEERLQIAETESREVLSELRKEKRAFEFSFSAFYKSLFQCVNDFQDNPDKSSMVVLFTKTLHGMEISYVRTLDKVISEKQVKIEDE